MIPLILVGIDVSYYVSFDFKNYQPGYFCMHDELLHFAQEPIFLTVMWKYEGCLVVLTSYDPKKNLLHMICIDLLSNVLVHPCWHWWKIGSGVLNSLHSCNLVSSMYVAERCKRTVYGVLVLVFKLAHVTMESQFYITRADSWRPFCASDSCKKRHLEFCNTHMLHSQTATNHRVGQYMIGDRFIATYPSHSYIPSIGDWFTRHALKNMLGTQTALLPWWRELGVLGFLWGPLINSACARCPNAMTRLERWVLASDETVVVFMTRLHP